MATRTTAADRFIDDVHVSWDTFGPWEATAAQGLAEPDEAALRSFCEEYGEDFETAQAEVLAYVRARVAAR